MDNNNHSTIIYLVIVLTSIIYLSTFLLNNSTSTDQQGQNDTDLVVDQHEQAVQQPKKKVRIIIQQPQTPISYRINAILPSILDEYLLEHTQCTDKDFGNPLKHLIPPSLKNASRSTKLSEPKRALVIYIAIGLLLTSLGAAIVDFFKAKSDLLSPMNDSSSSSTRKQKMLSRRFSLVDLTVLKHKHKEVMKKDGYGDMGTGSSSKKIERPTLRLD